MSRPELPSKQSRHFVLLGLQLPQDSISLDEAMKELREHVSAEVVDEFFMKFMDASEVTYQQIEDETGISVHTQQVRSFSSG